jgi:hypothetical protein
MTSGLPPSDQPHRDRADQPHRDRSDPAGGRLAGSAGSSGQTGGAGPARDAGAVGSSGEVRPGGAGQARDPSPPAPRTGAPGGGEVRPGGSAGQLDRAPGERYRDAGGASGRGASAGGGAGSRRTQLGSAGGDALGRGAVGAAGQPGERLRQTGRARGLVAAAAVGAAAAALIVLLGILDLSLGLVAISAATGWLVAVALRQFGGAAIGSARRRVLTAALIATLAVVLGLGLLWGWSLTEGGALGPLAYLVERFGLLTLAILAAAPLFAAARAR